MTIFGLFIFVIILTVGGMAVDIMRYEYKRVALQNTADRAVLAAGSMRQSGDPATVVRDYFRREGLENNLVAVKVDRGLNYRRVHVQTAATFPTILMKLLGVDELSIQLASAAEERYNKVEVSLVLDISGSMDENGRIEALRRAGVEFIDTLFDNAAPGRVSVSIIPYAGQVNPGPVLARQMNISPRLTQSHCVDFTEDQFRTTELSPTTSLVGTGHFDPSLSDETAQMFGCPVHAGAYSQISAFSSDPVELRRQITNLTGYGSTAIDIGVKWGAALLDPSMRPAISGMIDAGAVSDSFEGRPLDYDDPSALKVLVVMTDGVNDREARMVPTHKTGESPVYVDTIDNNVSIYLPSRPGNRKYYVPFIRSWQDHPWGAIDAQNLDSARRLTWDQVWARHSVYWVALNLYGIPLRNQWYSEYDIANNQYNNWWIKFTERAEKDQRLATICEAVRARDIPIFTIAFDAPPGGAAAMQDCATSASHFYDVDGTDISATFRAIAGSINRLRLTQ
ncbi:MULTISPECIES: Tad domain-containing protein [unclassified Yoonia]|uniref:Tad domain-containing protein n=1 Tax=unclassified Yoonia TaxID=2629118 RepID=UPI002AFEB2AA|nr:MULTISPECIES: Tad domain-containing protein [unclassified Yoonia]